MRPPLAMNPRLAALHTELGIPRAPIAARGLPEFAEADLLEPAELGADGREHLLTPAAAQAWRQLMHAALADGVSLYIVSAFRSIERQAEIFRRKLENGAAITDVLLVCAPPGCSEHHTGRAVDLATPGCPTLEVAFERTAAFAWLDARAADFGFGLSFPRGNRWGYQYEPWHWCFGAQRLTPPIPGTIISTNNRS